MNRHLPPWFDEIFRFFITQHFDIFFVVIKDYDDLHKSKDEIIENYDLIEKRILKSLATS